MNLSKETTLNTLVNISYVNIEIFVLFVLSNLYKYLKQCWCVVEHRSVLITSKHKNKNVLFH